METRNTLRLGYIWVRQAALNTLSTIDLGFPSTSSSSATASCLPHLASLLLVLQAADMEAAVVWGAALPRACKGEPAAVARV